MTGKVDDQIINKGINVKLLRDKASTKGFTEEFVDSVFVWVEDKNVKDYVKSLTWKIYSCWLQCVSGAAMWGAADKVCEMRTSKTLAQVILAQLRVVEDVIIGK